MQSVHIVSAYDEELKYLSKRIAAMGGHAERMVEQAVTALVNADPGLAQKVIRDDTVLDEGQREIDDKAIIIIAKRQPMAADLREIVGTIRISADLERVAISPRTLPSGWSPSPTDASRPACSAASRPSPTWR